MLKIPPPGFGGKSPYRSKIQKLKPGQFVPVKTEEAQRACYACGIRLGYKMARRTVDGKLRVYIIEEPKRGAK